jgi:hypothetical protein
MKSGAGGGHPLPPGTARTRLRLMKSGTREARSAMSSKKEDKEVGAEGEKKRRREKSGLDLPLGRDADFIGRQSFFKGAEALFHPPERERERRQRVADVAIASAR